MGIPMEMRDMWVQTRNGSTHGFLIASPTEQEKINRSKYCTQEGARQGAKAAGIAALVTAVPTLVACRTLPWAKANLNYTAQALIISAASIASYFITADKTILHCARRNAQFDLLARSQRDKAT
ncbi:early nodulin-93-like [Rutidosis leptorrhynchoides]|uniref:early nodulin-93-like n=1 Tax=Rutidosis leptorrhynchoides TaxID=125765 RepID=UPI003A998474